MIHVAVTIDTECDKDRRWYIRRPLSFRAIHEGIGERLQPLFERFGVVPTYLLSPEVIADSSSASFLASLGERAELGTHLHPEFITPQAQPDAVMTGMMQNRLPKQIEYQKLSALTDSFKRTFGYKPTSFRAGRFGISPYTIAILQELGYFVDSSVAPLQRWDDEGGCVDFSRARDCSYYRPSLENFLGEGDSEVIEIPVTIAAPFWLSVPAEIRATLMQSRLFGKRMRRLAGQRLQITWLRPWHSTKKQMIATAEHAVARHRSKGPVVLVMMFHNVEVIPGCSPYPQTDDDVVLYLDDLAGFFQHCLQQGWKFSGLTNAAKNVQAYVS